MKKYHLNCVSEDFMYVYSPICKVFKEFIAEDECIKNSYNDDIKDWDYISIVTKDKYSSGTTVSTVCSFDKYGAPLIVFTDDIVNDENGIRRYGHHYEVVAYENGINIWSIVPWHERGERPIKPTKIAFLEFPVKEDDFFELKVKVDSDKITVNMCGQTLEVNDAQIPEEFHIGITACEGVNKFREFTIE